ncbi:hypothetical protein [Schlesneria paludicola]|uniref:hypothetical protein n=1 Tax=Schlesneria paludicola TaxID=360056 RepID=UPI00029A1587|nr:hypothetical protein [Schlesneria paludicola]
MQSSKVQSAMPNHAHWWNKLYIIALAGIVGTSVGCGDAQSGKFKAKPRSVASGTVSLDGKPVAIGAVVFTHKESGLPSICPVENGAYKSPADKGPQIGVNSVLVSAKGEDGKMLWSTPTAEDVAVDDTKFAKDFALTNKQVKMNVAAAGKKRPTTTKVWPGDEE